MTAIQKVCLDQNRALYLISFDPETYILVYRSSWKPQALITEEISIEGDKVHLQNHWFHINYLNNLLILNTP